MVNGSLGYHNLSSWWLSTFSEAERRYIESVYHPLGTSLSERLLTQGQITYSGGTAAMLLSGLATSFYSKSDRRLARLMLTEAKKQAESSKNILDLHFIHQGIIKAYYPDRDADPDALDVAIGACEDQIALAPKAAHAFRREYPGEHLPSHTGFVKLAIIREKQKEYAEAIKLSLAAMDQGWAEDWQRRIARCEKKQSATSPKRSEDSH